MTQLATTAFDDAHQMPPPLSKLIVSPLFRVAPRIKVKPISEAPFVNHAQRTALVPLVAPAPRIVVTHGPLTLCTVIVLVKATRLVKSPAMTLPPRSEEHTS